MRNGPQQLERELEKRLSFSLIASPAAAGQARHALARASGVLLERLGRNGLLLLTELVNNAVIHGSSSQADEVSVAVRESSASVRVEVRDDGPGFSWRHPPEERERASGYGLVLVEAVADRWGIDTSTGRTCVWFEL
jgi:anti-sigma regulatory factor (Ser/Thr protein kinase)